MLKESDSITLRDTPIRLVLKIIVLQLIFSLLYVTVALISNRHPAFDEGLLWGVITYDVLTFTVLVILQQLITLYWLLRWLTKSYTFTEQEVTVRDGIIFKRNLVIPLRSIKTVKQHHDRIGKLFNLSTITIALIDEPYALVMPHMADPQQVLKYLEWEE